MERLLRPCIPETLGALAAAALLAMAVPTSAHAATGTLIVNGTTYENPSGCINTVGPTLSMVNTTDKPATVYLEGDCKGSVIGTVGPGGKLNILASSLFLP